jgi:high-affinity iron transporter
VLPTFVIGLREGLEAVLIVTIIATFLRQNKASLRGLWIGVGAGVALSIVVGIVLKVIEQALPQAQQEGMETVIGGVAVFFVTGMVLWMRTHARSMKRELETAAAAALKDGTTTALALMAFLSVLREGFETSVFLLATFQSASSAPAAMLGALLGIAAAIGLGWLMFAGGVRINLHRFFTVTGVFLVLVAAGLVLNAFRTGHEAGWVTVGQGKTLDLSWLTPTGSVRSALITGVLGIPADPRVIELLGWACYLVPMLALTFWPSSLKPTFAVAQRLRLAGAGLAAVVAVVLLATVGRPQATIATEAPVESGGTAMLTVAGSTATLVHDGHTVTLSAPTPTDEDGADTRWTAQQVGGQLPTTLTLQQLLDDNGGRIPSGMSIATAKGPFTASWTDKTSLTVLTRDGGLVDAYQDGSLILSYSGGGLTTPRVLTVDGWQLAPSYVASTSAAIAAADATAHDRLLWKQWVPAFLGLLAVCLLGQALRLRTRARRQSAAASGANAAPQPAQPADREGKPQHVRSQA